VSAISDWSESLNSSYTKDDSLAFESPILLAAYEAWASFGTIPPRSAFTPRSAKAFVGNLIIFERQADTYLVRLMGTRISAVLGEMQGKILAEAVPGEVALRWKSVLDLVLAEMKPTRLVKTVAFNDLHYLEAELCLAPLLDAQGHPTMVLAVAAFRSGVAPKSKLGELIAASR
jgi:hypothetical protein